MALYMNVYQFRLIRDEIDLRFNEPGYLSATLIDTQDIKQQR